ncbi:hypothetical protein [Pedobacter sp. Leaf216]|uniref:hypothetical protein n=1 Tax=Pedobacter sp. Leaf216 TaxID=1735684 RepID=UPI000B1676AC|nr:hypothetical protein [Pedobacter sp. Leaf216]
MSIYFQYPAISEYPNQIFPLNSEKEDHQILRDEDSLIKDQILELRDYLSLKQL